MLSHDILADSTLSYEASMEDIDFTDMSRLLARPETLR